MVVAYIYITRIVVYLLRSTMPYRYVWLSDAAGAASCCLSCQNHSFPCARVCWRTSRWTSMPTFREGSMQRSAVEEHQEDLSTSGGCWGCAEDLEVWLHY